MIRSSAHAGSNLPTRFCLLGKGYRVLLDKSVPYVPHGVSVLVTVVLLRLVTHYRRKVSRLEVGEVYQGDHRITLGVVMFLPCIAWRRQQCNRVEDVSYRLAVLVSHCLAAS